MIKKPKYKVVVEGNLQGLKFPDLLIKYTTGYYIPLQVKKGEYIPLDQDIIDPTDLKKSLVVGCLGKFLKAGWVIDENAQPKRKPRQKIKKKVKKVETPDPVQKSQPPIEDKQPETPQTKVEPILKESSEQVETDLSQVKTIDNFNKLGHFQRLQFTKICNDKALLNQILEQLPTNADQLKVLISTKLEKLK